MTVIRGLNFKQNCSFNSVLKGNIINNNIDGLEFNDFKINGATCKFTEEN